MKNLAGQRFGKLLAIAHVGWKQTTSGRLAVWSCQCDCGKATEATVHALGRGSKKSCGCLLADAARENSRTTRAKVRTHGESSPKSAEYVIWQAMPQLGARCLRWDKYPNFLEDMGRRPKGKVLLRKDGGAPFGRENCSWGRLTTPAEPVLADALEKAFGIRPTTEHRFHPERRWRFDVAYVNQKLAIELNGFRFHGSAKARRNDAEKSNAAVEMGWRVLTFPANEVFNKTKLAAMVDLISRVGLAG